ncbi:head-tail adaptor protein [Listeria booriae]|uniref:head-tail adaptor protein n=1 Tax=Listeria booriae TaxID=1552123 RepID=UPI001626DC93|nr:head-tail adaptor protein [Listeria booriae]MBC2196305.1 phage head-tail joining protein [Listeria booriae]
MLKVKTNERKWKADLMTRTQTIDDDDRAVPDYIFKRVVYYKTLGVTAQEKSLSVQEKAEVVKRINIVIDSQLNTKDFGIRIGEQLYNIERIWTDDDKREMELSLSYVD